MDSTKKRINQFYKDYKKINTYIYENSDLNKKEIAKIINYEIVKKFLDQENIHTNNGLYKLLLFEKPQIRYDLFFSYIQDIVHKYSWSLNEGTDSLTPDIIGSVFEKYVNQRENGAYYTDADTIYYILDQTILWAIIYKLNCKNIIRKNYIKYFNDTINHEDTKIKLFKRVISESNNSDVIELLEVLKGFKLADISVGTGAFLVSAMDYLVELYMICNEKLDRELDLHSVMLDLMEHTIHGVDIMSDAIDIAKFRLILKSIQILKLHGTALQKIPKLNLYKVNTLTYNKWSLVTSDKTGKFDCIIGNPPYVEYSQVKDYELSNYSTLRSGNLYAFMIEKSIDLLDKNGVLGLIVPISLVSTLRMSHVRKYLYNNMGKILIANFADRPGTLFNGVHQKLSIISAQKDVSKTPEIFTTSYIHWYEKERSNLFKSLTYIKNKFINTNSDFIMKYSNRVEENILKKILSQDNSILSLSEKDGNYTLSMSTRMTFWIKTFPEFIQSSEYKKFYFDNIDTRDLFYLLLNSDIFFFYWECISDGWHITNKELLNFKIDFSKIDSLCHQEINRLAQLLNDDIDINKEYIGSKQVDYIFKHKKSKLIIDEINLLVSKLFDLSKYEVEYLRKYNISYRMNDELDHYEKRRSLHECN